MKRLVVIIGICLSVIAVALQYYLILQNRTTGILETTLRFFTFFTILTNSLVAIYFCALSFFPGSKAAAFFRKFSTVTAITVYITIVGLVYQFILRKTWEPEGLQMIVDELLHSVNPAFFLLYWILIVPKERIRWRVLPYWLMYPLVYFLIIILRGQFTGYYPYPFVDVSKLGMQQVIVNALIIVALFGVLSMLFILIGRGMAKKDASQSVLIT